MIQDPQTITEGIGVQSSCSFVNFLHYMHVPLNKAMCQKLRCLYLTLKAYTELFEHRKLQRNETRILYKGFCMYQ